jgi:molybdate transport system substrate-binding protein
MRHLAVSDAIRPVGMTQSTEIISTEGVQLSGPLPKGSDLSTVYTAAVTTGAEHTRQAQILIELLTSADQRELRAQAGFLETQK